MRQSPDTCLQRPDLKLNYLPSPNVSGRNGAAPSVIVLHSTGGTFSSAANWLRNPAAKVSAHLLVNKAGEALQLVPLSKAAWHAGASSYKGRDNVNAFSIGIEMAHVDGLDAWPETQLRAVAHLCAILQKAYQISHIVSHAEVATPAGRKVDPVAFPWERFRALLAEAKGKL